MTTSPTVLGQSMNTYGTELTVSASAIPPSIQSPGISLSLNPPSNGRSPISRLQDTWKPNSDGEPMVGKAVCSIVLSSSTEYGTHHFVKLKRKRKPQVTPRGNCALVWPVVRVMMEHEVEPPIGIFIYREETCFLQIRRFVTSKQPIN